MLEKLREKEIAAYAKLKATPFDAYGQDRYTKALEQWREASEALCKAGFDEQLAQFTRDETKGKTEEEVAKEEVEELTRLYLGVKFEEFIWDVRFQRFLRGGKRGDREVAHNPTAV